MHIDLFMLIFLSLPEFLLELPLILLISGEKEKLKFNAKNTIKFSMAIALMLSATWLIRPHVSNTVQSIACHTVAYVLIILVVYRIHPFRALLGVTWAILYVDTLENTFIPFVIAYISKGLNNFYGSNITLILVSLPVRTFQFLAVRYFYKNDEYLNAIRSEKKYSIIFAVSCYLMTLSEVFIAYVYYTYFDKFSFMVQLLFSCALLILMISFFMAIFGFIYIVVKKFANDVKCRDEKQKQQSAIKIKRVNEKNHDTLKELYNILKNEKYTGDAIDLLEEHLHIGSEQKAK